MPGQRGSGGCRGVDPSCCSPTNIWFGGGTDVNFVTAMSGGCINISFFCGGLPGGSSSIWMPGNTGGPTMPYNLAVYAGSNISLSESVTS